MSDDSPCPDQATFDAEVERLTGICLLIRRAARQQGIEIDTAARQASESGMLSPEDAEIVQRVFLGKG